MGKSVKLRRGEAVRVDGPCTIVGVFDGKGPPKRIHIITADKVRIYSAGPADYVCPLCDCSHPCRCIVPEGD